MRANILVLLAPLQIIALVGIVGSQTPPKHRINSVRFEGNNAFPDKRLHGVMLSRPSTILSRHYYYPQILEHDLESLALFYRQNGFLEAAITGHEVRIDAAQNRAHIRIQVTENERTYVEGVAFLGNEVFSDQLLFERTKMVAGVPLSQMAIEEATVTILALYADQGYLDCDVNPDVRVDSLNHRALIDFTINERAQYTIGNIDLKGLEKTRPRVVHRELDIQTGQMVSYTRLLDSQQKLYLSGLFQSVFVRPVSAGAVDSTTKDILIELQEKPSGEFNVSLGYGSVEKMRGKIEIFNTNLIGTARKLSLSAKLSFVNAGLAASFTEPWTFGIPWRTDINLLAEYLEEPGYNLNRAAGEITFGRSFLKRSSARLTYRLERAKFSKVKVISVPEQQNTNIRSLNLSLTYDTRDNLFNSTQGTYFEWSNELAGTFLGSSSSFIRSIIRFKKFSALSRFAVLGTALEIGWIHAAGGLSEIPLNERLYSGGPNSMRGFEYRKVGPLDENRVPLGGAFKIAWNAFEIRRSLYRMIGGAMFLDVGNVWNASNDFDFGDLRTSLGFGVRVNTPVGLARLDYGINLGRKNGEAPGELYISMGQAF